MSEATKTGSRAQQFNHRHEEFLKLWADGLHSLEIMRKLKISENQLSKHVLKAVEESAARKTPEYDCIFWKDLPSKLKKALQVNAEEAEEPLVKIEVESDGIILTLIADSNFDGGHVAV